MAESLDKNLDEKKVRSEPHFFIDE